MNDSHIISIAQIKQFLKIDTAIQFKTTSRKEKYEWIEEVLDKFRYFRLRKKDRGIILEYIARMTGLSKSQVGRIIKRKKKTGRVFLDSTKRHKFPVKYNASDIALLIKTDNLHKRLSGAATKDIIHREYNTFGKEEYRNLSRISPSHIYNLREVRQYKSHSTTFKKTQSRQVPIGKREKPKPDGKSGFLRIDTVHQGDYKGKKGVYHINIVDEVLQWEVVGSVEQISERYLEPLLKDLIEQIPFKIINFHSDNGSEFINKVVAKLLNKLLVRQTKSRSRHCNDNALVEGKNGAVVRKHMGYLHIPANFAREINKFYREYFNIYLNYHRPSGFAEVIKDRKGKIKKTYPARGYQTPYEKLKSLDNPEQYLKPGITFGMLDEIAYRKSDNDFAEEMKKIKQDLFKNFKHIPYEMIESTSFISHAYVD